jgi:hypothetical protein
MTTIPVVERRRWAYHRGMLTGGRRLRSRILVGVAVYVAVLVTIPFEHDDLRSHLRSPTHCAACMSSPVAAPPASTLTVETVTLGDAGRAAIAQLFAAGTLLPSRSTGRSPPPAA